MPQLIHFFISALGFLGALIAAGALFLTGGIALLQWGSKSEGLFPLFSFAWMAFFLAWMVFPGLIGSFSSLSGIRLPSWKGPSSNRLSKWLMLAWPVLMIAGQLAAGKPGVDWLVLPPLQLLVVGIPIFWFVETGRHKIGAHNPARNWGFISVGVIIIPALVLFAELVLLGLITGVFLLWVGGQPAVIDQISRLAQEMINSPMDVALLEEAVAMLASNPWFVVLLLAITAIFIPLIEETLKPAALWFLAGKKITPAQGFEAGLICGGTFAFLESLGLFGTAFLGEWSAVVLARFGTGLLHSLTSGLVGWAMVSIWSRRKVIRSGLVFLLAVFLHGLWNAFGVILGLAAYLQQGSSGWLAVIYRLGKVAPYALFVITAAMYLFLILINRQLRFNPQDGVRT